MKTTERFTNAVTKLYNAFHNVTLNAMSPCACAVGNLCNNTSEWSRNGYIAIETGYSPLELETIENIFMFGHPITGNGIWKVETVNSRLNDNNVFEALCAVVEYLCELDGIPNVMDYTCLFETENEKPKYELSF